MVYKPDIDYFCIKCGAQAVSVPGTPGTKARPNTARVMVPHEQDCPTAARLAAVREQVQTQRR